MEPELVIADYPQLSLLAWNRAGANISEAEAFALYERNWRFVDLTQITENEVVLINRLKTLYGRGILNV